MLLITYIFVFLISCKFSNCIDYDIIVYGATPSGIEAALSSAQEGKSVLLATPMPLIGGMMTSGLGYTDKGHTSAIGGCASQFFKLVCEYYKSSADACYTFEPHVAESIFIDLISNNPGPGTISVYLNATLIGTRVNIDGKGLEAVIFAPTIDAIEANDRIDDLILHSSNIDVKKHFFESLESIITVSASIFIDSSYEGDLIALAGLRYYVGRESNITYNESYGGVLFEPSPYGSHQFNVYINPYQEASVKVPINFVQDSSPGPVNFGDKKVQAYNFRLCMTQNKTIAKKWQKPPNYSSNDWELLIRYITAANITDINSLIRLNTIPNGKTDTNNFGPISTDMIGASWSWPEGKPYQRKEIFEKHKEYTQGFFYFLSTDIRVPQMIQNEVNSWGLCADEWSAYSYDSYPPQLYVREGRRMIGDFVFSQRDRQYDWYKNDSIGLFSYNIDSHHVQRYIDELSGGVLNEGDFELFGNESLGQMPYRLLLPSIGQPVGSNILSSVALSASHMGYGCLRLEPQLMILGQAAGIAASQAINENTIVQNISIENLQARLRYLGAKIDL